MKYWLVIAVVAACSGGDRLGKARRMPWRPVAHPDLAASAATYRGKGCGVTGENLSGREESPECGPFPCMLGHCYVEACPPDGACGAGFCADGYCVRSEAGGQKQCELVAQSTPPSDAELVARAGCTCTPQALASPRDQPVCGSFPCAPDGCYVARCSGDGDCALGLCSHHASAPHGYCVTADPY